MKLGRALGGAIVGVLAVGIEVAVAQATSESTFAVIPLLAVAMVGLALGSTASMATYVVAGPGTIGATILLSESLVSPADVARVTAFVVGAPMVIVMARRAEREHLASEGARELSAAAEQTANRERAAAEGARRELQAALQQVEHERTRLEEVAEAIPEPLIVYDQHGTGTYANRAALRTFGRSFSDQPLAEWGRLAQPRDDRGRPLPTDAWPQVLGRSEVVRRRMLVTLPMSGRDLLVDVVGTPLPDGGCVLLLRDVGREVDERRRLSRFAAFVAHELRNPLAVAKARIELASRGTGQPEGGDLHGQRALESVDAAIAILERLELFSRAEAGGLEVERSEFDLKEASARAIERLRARGSQRPVTVILSGEPQVDGDRQLTEMALTNLLINADRYSDESHPIEVQIDGADVPEVRVRDGGPGISEEIADQLFRDRVSSGRGLGLGLYLVRAAMDAQGGGVALEQRQPGAVFVLRWPRRELRR